MGYNTYAQDTTNLKVVKNENGIITLKATETYYSLPKEEKPAFIRMALSSMYSNEIIVIEYEHQREFWRKNTAKNEFICFDTLNIDNPDLRRFIKKRPERFMAHPWFFHWGLNATFSLEDDIDSYVNYNIYANVRAGFFLLLNMWDIAVSVAIGNGGSVDKDNFLVSTGLITKVYFPIKQINLSPYVGGGVSYNYTSQSDYSGRESISTSTHYIGAPFTVGVNWRLGPGSFDVGAQYGYKTEFMMIAGYTFFPGLIQK